MKTTLIRLKVLADKQQEFEALVGQLAKDVAANEPEPKFYEVRRSKDDPLSYVYLFSFADDAAQQSYQDADYHTKMSPVVMQYLDGDPVFEELDSFY